MLPLLSGPLRRWLLISLLVPAIAFLLRTLGRYLERRHQGQPTRTSRVLLSSSAFLRRRVGKEPDPAAVGDGASVNRG